jgi:hypothetical protein
MSWGWVTGMVHDKVFVHSKVVVNPQTMGVGIQLLSTLLSLCNLAKPPIQLAQNPLLTACSSCKQPAHPLKIGMLGCHNFCDLPQWPYSAENSTFQGIVSLNLPSNDKEKNASWAHNFPPSSFFDHAPISFKDQHYETHHADYNFWSANGITYSLHMDFHQTPGTSMQTLQ